MKLKAEKFKKLCATVITAVESGVAQKNAGVLTLETKGNYLYLNTAGTDYYLSARFLPEEFSDINVSVQASLFLKLIADLDSDEIELLAKDKYLSIKSSTGSFKVPYIFINDKPATLVPITINNPVTEMNIDGDVLYSILQFNSKELVKTVWQKQELQKLFYVDQLGCITFTNGACINSFSLEKPVRFLLKDKIVKLFKLFNGTGVHFTLGYDDVENRLTQTKVSFETEDIVLTAITMLNESVLLVKAGEDQIRALGNKIFPYTLILDTEAMRRAINRLLLFVKKEDQLLSTAIISCNQDELSILGAGENTEVIKVGMGSIIDGEYKMRVQLYDLKLVFDSAAEPTITMSFGDRRVVALTRGNVKNLIPEDRYFNG